jgi:hypothetical protein
VRPQFDVVLATTGITGNVVQFVATSNHTNTYFLWNFGDGMEGYGSTESHTYAKAEPIPSALRAGIYNELAQDSCWQNRVPRSLLQVATPVRA